MHRFSVCDLKTASAVCKLHNAVSKNVSQVNLILTTMVVNIFNKTMLDLLQNVIYT